MAFRTPSDYPPVPPGVKMFDPRRFRRHARKQEGFIGSLLRKREVAEKEKHDALRREALARREKELALRELQKEKSLGFLARVKRVFSRRKV